MIFSFRHVPRITPWPPQVRDMAAFRLYRQGDATMIELLKDDYRLLRLLKFAPFERRSGGWRFGTKRICSCTVERLIASGAAALQGKQVIAVTVKAKGRRR